MKIFIIFLTLSLPLFGKAQTYTVPDSVLSELNELRDRQNRLATVVSYSGHNIKKGIVFIGLGFASSIAGGVLVAIPSKSNEMAGKVTVQQAIGLGFLSLGCVLNLSGIISIGVGGAQMDRLKVN
jgi:hypothetical protein